MSEENWCTKFNYEEWRVKGVKTVRIFTYLQLVMALASLTVGAVALSFTARNPSFPKTNVFPLVSGLLLLIAAVLGKLTTRSDLRDEEMSTVKQRVIAHSMITNVCLLVSVLQVVFAILSLVDCYSIGLPAYQICQPYASVNGSLFTLTIVSGALVFKLCLIGAVVFCVHRRQLDCLTTQNGHQTLVNESDPESKGKF